MTIEGSGYPLGFALDRVVPAPVFLGGSGETVVMTEARMMSGHQKEAIVHEGIGGPRWRLTSDEGEHLQGADMAPFPLGFFNAGLHGDLMARLAAAARDRGVTLGRPELSIRNVYWMTGSLTKGTGEGFSAPSEIRLGGAPDILIEAAAASPAFDALKRPLKNRFALYVNGKREETKGVTPSKAADAPDPYLTYRASPAPLGDHEPAIIRKTGFVEDGVSTPTPEATDNRITFTVSGQSRFIGDEAIETDTWLEMPGASHFALQSSWAADHRKAPSGLALVSAGIAFCYLTQLSRYIRHPRLEIGGVRLVQYTPYSAGAKGRAGPVDTHLFLNGGADNETHSKLLRIAARTCYLHAALSAELPPVLKAYS